MEMNKVLEKIREYEHLHNFPPFSIKRQTERDEFASDFMGVDVLHDDPFAEVEKVWSEQLKEARMYSQRYGNDWKGARDAAAKIAGIDVDEVTSYEVLRSPSGLSNSGY
jgi:hypothetical protein